MLFHKISNVIRLSHGSRMVLLQAFMLLLLARLELSVVPFRVIRKRLLTQSKPGVSAYHDVATLVRALAQARRFVPVSTCLVQALAGRVLLARSGYDTTLVIGVQKTAGQFKAHAWLELGGVTVVGALPDLTLFTPLDRFSWPDSQRVAAQAYGCDVTEQEVRS